MSNDIAKDIEKINSSISEKAFINSILVSVITILVSLACLTAATWAWFTEESSSAGNTIQAASYELEIKVLDPNGMPLDPSEEGLTRGYHIYHLEAGNRYTVVLSANGTASNCYCIVTAEGKTYYTNLIPTVAEAENNPSKYYISSQTDVEVVFDLRWGIHENVPDLVNGSTIDISAQNVNNQ